MIIAEKKLQIRSNSALIYTKFTGTSLRTIGQRASALANLTHKNTDGEDKRKPYSGEMTVGSTKRLNKAIDIMVETCERKFIPNPYKPGKWMPFQIGFLTLTIHNPGQMVTGKEAHKNLLGPFLQWLRRSQECYLYIWKAELQMKRQDCNQLHYHLLLGKFIRYEVIKEKWNELNRNAGYLDQYYKDHGHYNAPSVDIGGVIDYRDISSYLKKAIVSDVTKSFVTDLQKTSDNIKAEMSKGVQNVVPIVGKLWDCSANIKEAKRFEVNADEYASEIGEMMDRGELYNAFENDNVQVLKFKTLKPFELLDVHDRRARDQMFRDIRERDFEIKETGIVYNYKPKINKPPVFELRPLSEIGLFMLN